MRSLLFVRRSPRCLWFSMLFLLCSHGLIFFPRPYLGLDTPAFSFQARTSVGIFIFVVVCRENLSSSSGVYSLSLFVFMGELKNILFLFCVAHYSFCVCVCVVVFVLLLFVCLFLIFLFVYFVTHL